MDANRKFWSVCHSRGTGRTHAAVEGVKNCETAVLVVHSKAFGEQLKRHHNCPNMRIVALDELDKLRGCHPAYVFDHFTIELLWQEREHEFHAELAKLKRQIEQHKKETQSNKTGNEKEITNE